MFMKNIWYVAAWASEVHEILFSRCACDQPLMLLRAVDGKVAALHDRCPHRLGARQFEHMKPLSMPSDEGAVRARRVRKVIDPGHQAIEVSAAKNMAAVKQYGGRAFTGNFRERERVI